MSLRIFWVETRLNGRLAIMPRPLGGERLVDDILALRAQGVETVLSLLEDQEASDLELTDEAAICAAQNI